MNLLKIWYHTQQATAVFSLRFVHSKPQHLSLCLLGVWTQNVINCNAQIKTMIGDMPKSKELWYDT